MSVFNIILEKSVSFIFFLNNWIFFIFFSPGKSSLSSVFATGNARFFFGYNVEFIETVLKLSKLCFRSEELIDKFCILLGLKYG